MTANTDCLFFQPSIFFYYKCSSRIIIKVVNYEGDDSEDGTKKEQTKPNQVITLCIIEIMNNSVFARSGRVITFLVL